MTTSLQVIIGSVVLTGHRVSVAYDYEANSKLSIEVLNTKSVADAACYSCGR